MSLSFTLVTELRNVWQWWKMLWYQLILLDRFFYKVIICYQWRTLVESFGLSARLIVISPCRQRLWRILNNCQLSFTSPASCHFALIISRILIDSQTSSETKLNQHWMKAFSLLIKHQNIYCCVSLCMKYIAQCSHYHFIIDDKCY